MRSIKFPKIKGERDATLIINNDKFCQTFVKKDGSVELRVSRTLKSREIEEYLAEEFNTWPGINKVAVMEVLAAILPEIRNGVLYHYIVAA